MFKLPPVNRLLFSVPQGPRTDYQFVSCESSTQGRAFSGKFRPDRSVQGVHRFVSPSVQIGKDLSADSKVCREDSARFPPTQSASIAATYDATVGLKTVC